MSSAKLDHASRSFEFGGSVDGVESPKDQTNQKKEEFMKYLQEQTIGDGVPFSGPFGKRKMAYCDFTASGKSLGFIETYIQNQVLPFYGNTHTTTSVTGRQSTFFRHEARELVKHAIHGTEEDVLLFTGTGATSAVHKMIGCLGLDHLNDGDLVVFVSTYEHHSNLLPWRELGAKVITIPEDATGMIDFNQLENELQAHLHYRVKIGAFSAASNVTGILTNQNRITACLHRYEALAFWDFAAAGPYIPVDMNPIVEGPDRHLVYKDAIFLSPHKFLGGVGCPGLLIAKRKLFQRPTPKECGGGTVFFVSREDHRYLSSIEEREEGGTPDIVGSIRCGLVFQLKQQIGDDFIHKRESMLVQRAKASLKDCSGFVLLGPTKVERIPIFSFLIEHNPSGLYLHHNVVCAMLNDVFGIQVRGGCVCAGPYAQELLGIDYETSKRFEDALLQLSANDKELETLLPRERDRQGAGTELLRPGFVRINFHYTMDEAAFLFVLSALKQIATNGWKLLPLYKFNTDTGEWMHKHWSLQRDRKWIGSIQYFPDDGPIGFHIPERQHHTGKASQGAEIELPVDRGEYFRFVLEESEKIFSSVVPSSMDTGAELLLFNEVATPLRWFLLPSEANQFLSGEPLMVKPPPSPFSIKQYEDPRKEEVESISSPLPCSSPSLETDPLDSSQVAAMAPSQEDLFEEFAYDDDEDEEEVKKVAGTFKFHVPERHLLHSSFAALDDFNMIKDGDRVIACISGGKDSLSMLHILKHYQFLLRSKGIHFDLAAATVDPLTHSTYNPTPLKLYMKELGIEYFYLEDSIMERAKNAEECKSICSYCSRMKRGMLYTCARKEKYNVLALGQHLDDLAESFMMSLFHNGLLRTMKASYANEEGDLRIIRPLVNTRERDLAKFAAEKKLPVIPENCPACFEEPKERHRLKQLLAAQENIHKNVFSSIKLAIKPLASINQCGIENVSADKTWISDILPHKPEDAAILEM